jgi:transposase
MKRIELEMDDKTVSELKTIIKKGKRTVREVIRAELLLLAHEGKRNDEITEILHINRDTVLKVKKRFIEGGMNRSVHDASRPGQPKKYGEKETAEIIALACSSPPEGRKRWSIRLLVEELKKMPSMKGINREVVRMILKKQHKAMEEKNVVHPDHR